VLDGLASVVSRCLLDLHRDADHHRAVFTLGGPPAAVERAARQLVTAAVHELDLTDHRGVHPRFGVADVVPFVPLGQARPVRGDEDLSPAVSARDRFAAWLAEELGMPCFLYGPLPDGERTLPEVRRRAFKDLWPDTGPPVPHPRAGAVAVGARRPLVAYNLWVSGLEDNDAASVAAAVRTPTLRTLALAVRGHRQISCNLVEPFVTGPADAYDAVAAALPGGAAIAAAELVGLVPQGVLDAVPQERWTTLDLSGASTIEARLRAKEQAPL
jgi:glutamate formiminotransferase